MKPELIKLLREEAHDCIDRMTPERLCHFVGYEQPKEALQTVVEGEIPPSTEDKPSKVTVLETTPPEPPKENETIPEMKKRLTPLVLAWRNKKAEETGEAKIKILKGLYKEVSGEADITFDDLTVEQAKEVEKIVTGG